MIIYQPSISGSLTVTGSVIAVSFTGSFSGSGADLNSIPSSAIVGLNLSQIATGSVTASVTPSQFSIVSGSSTEFIVTGTGITIGSSTVDIHKVTGSFNASDMTGSLFGTASFAVTASYAMNGGSGGGNTAGTNLFNYYNFI